MYNSQRELVTFKTQDAGSMSNVPTVVESLLQLKSILRKKTVSLLMACEANEKTIHIYNLSESRPIHTLKLDPEKSELKTMTFFSDKELIIADSKQEVLQIYNISTGKPGASVPLAGVLGIIVIKEYIVAYARSRVILVWNTRTQEHTEINTDLFVCEIHPIGNNQFVVCHDDMWVNIYQLKGATAECVSRIESQCTDILSIDRLDQEHLVVAQADRIYSVNTISYDVDKLLKIEDISKAYYLKMTDTNKVVITHYMEGTSVCSIFELTTGKSTMKVCEPSSSSYKPFSVKGSLLVYYENEFLVVYDTNTYGVVKKIEGDFSVMADVAIW